MHHAGLKSTDLGIVHHALLTALMLGSTWHARCAAESPQFQQARPAVRIAQAPQSEGSSRDSRPVERPPADGALSDPASGLTIDTRPNLEQFVLPRPVPLPAFMGNMDRHAVWPATLKTWTAADFYHRPLYFEQPNLERYGQRPRHGQMAAVLSAAHFFGSVPLLPYKLGQQPPCERQYVLGYGRPGDCQFRQLPVRDPSLRGGLLQATTVAGMVFLIP